MSDLTASEKVLLELVDIGKPQCMAPHWPGRDLRSDTREAVVGLVKKGYFKKTPDCYSEDDERCLKCDRSGVVRIK